MKKDNKNRLKELQEEARQQVMEYGKLEEISNIKNLNKYTVIAMNDELFVEEIK